MSIQHRFGIAFALASVFALGAAATSQPAFAAGADNNANKSDSDQPVTDTWITTKVKSELATTEGVKSMDIDVKTVNGVVTLSGNQPNDMAVQKAVAAAKSIKGVKRVDSSGLKASGATRQ